MRPPAEKFVLDQIVSDVCDLQAKYPKAEPDLRWAVMGRLAASGVGREGDLARLMSRIKRRMKHA